MLYCRRFLSEGSVGLRVLSLPASACVCVCVCVRAITHHPFKVASPNLDQRCKIDWWIPNALEAIDFDFQGQFWLKISPHFDLARNITHHPFKLGSSNLDHRHRSLMFGDDWPLKSHNFIMPGFTTRVNTQPPEKAHHRHDYLDCFT